jgi:hypothetical protein
MLSELKAGMIFDAIRHGRAIFWMVSSRSAQNRMIINGLTSMIWPAPRAATGGKISAFVMAKPPAVHNALDKRKSEFEW